MVGQGGVRTELMLVTLIDKNTKFGTFANKYTQQEGWGFTHNEAKIWDIGINYTPIACLKSMSVFHRLIWTCLGCFKFWTRVVHGPTRRHVIGNADLASAAFDLLSIFEIPVYQSLSGKYSVEEIKNLFTAFRSSEACADIWKTTVARYARLTFDHTVVYTYYRSLMGMLDIDPWAFTCLFLLIFPTGNAIAERGFSAMGATHTKTRSDLSHEQVWAHMMVQFNGHRYRPTPKCWMLIVSRLTGGAVLAILIITINNNKSIIIMNNTIHELAYVIVILCLDCYYYYYKKCRLLVRH